MMGTAMRAGTGLGGSMSHGHPLDSQQSPPAAGTALTATRSSPRGRRDEGRAPHRGDAPAEPRRSGRRSGHAAEGVRADTCSGAPPRCRGPRAQEGPKVNRSAGAAALYVARGRPRRGGASPRPRRRRRSEPTESGRAALTNTQRKAAPATPMWDGCSCPSGPARVRRDDGEEHEEARARAGRGPEVERGGELARRGQAAGAEQRRGPELDREGGRREGRGDGRRGRQELADLRGRRHLSPGRARRVELHHAGAEQLDDPERHRGDARRRAGVLGHDLAQDGLAGHPVDDPHLGTPRRSRARPARRRRQSEAAPPPPGARARAAPARSRRRAPRSAGPGARPGAGARPGRRSRARGRRCAARRRPAKGLPQGRSPGVMDARRIQARTRSLRR